MARENVFFYPLLINPGPLIKSNVATLSCLAPIFLFQTIKSELFTSHIISLYPVICNSWMMAKTEASKEMNCRRAWRVRVYFVAPGARLKAGRRRSAFLSNRQRQTTRHWHCVQLPRTASKTTELSVHSLLNLIHQVSNAKQSILKFRINHLTSQSLVPYILN